MKNTQLQPDLEDICIKNYVHNEREAETLINEHVNPAIYNGTAWFKHDGTYLFHSKVYGPYRPIILREYKL